MEGLQIMTEDSARKEIGTATINDIRVEITPDSNVVVYYSSARVRIKPAIEAVATLEDRQANTFVMYGAKVELADDGILTVYTNGGVKVKPAIVNGTVTPTAAANDTVAPTADLTAKRSGLKRFFTWATALVLGSGIIVGSYKICKNPADDTATPHSTTVQDGAATPTSTILEIGNRMPDGTIYAGISPDTKQPMYAAPADAPMSMDFNEAAEYAKGLEVGGKKDFRVPSLNELNVLFQSRDKGALKGTFNLTSSSPELHWSSTSDNAYVAWYKRFSRDGGEGYGDGFDQRGDLFRDNKLSVRCVR